MGGERIFAPTGLIERFTRSYRAGSVYLVNVVCTRCVVVNEDPRASGGCMRSRSSAQDQVDVAGSNISRSFVFLHASATLGVLRKVVNLHRVIIPVVPPKYSSLAKKELVDASALVLLSRSCEDCPRQCRLFVLCTKFIANNTCCKLFPVFISAAFLESFTTMDNTNVEHNKQLI